jgi:hypothetical protein
MSWLRYHQVFTYVPADTIGKPVECQITTKDTETAENNNQPADAFNKSKDIATEPVGIVVPDQQEVIIDIPTEITHELATSQENANQRIENLTESVGAPRDVVTNKATEIIDVPVGNTNQLAETDVTTNEPVEITNMLAGNVFYSDSIWADIQTDEVVYHWI